MQIKLDKALESIDRIKLELDKEVVDKAVIRQGMAVLIDCISEMGRQIIVKDEFIEKTQKLWNERNIVDKEFSAKLMAEADRFAEEQKKIFKDKIVFNSPFSWIKKLFTRRSCVSRLEEINKMPGKKSWELVQAQIKEHPGTDVNDVFEMFGFVSPTGRAWKKFLKQIIEYDDALNSYNKELK